MASIDWPRLYTDLQETLGAANASIPWICSNHWLNGALAQLDTLYDEHDYSGIIEFACDQGVNISDYILD